MTQQQFGCLGTLVIFGLGFGLVYGCIHKANTIANSPAAKAESAARWDNAGAVVAAETFVSRALLSPATAKYPFGLTAQPAGNGVYHVTSYVDSQNAFGAMLRTQFDCTVKQAPGGWECLSLIVDGKTIK